jgi:ABC-type polysaccharide/polyol phosphate export permease
MSSSNISAGFRRKNFLERLLQTFDEFTQFMALEAALILRYIRLTRGKSNNPVFGSVGTIVIIVSHIYFFWLISRSMPAGISQVEFCTPAFTMWFLLRGSSKYRKAPAFPDKSIKHTNVKWINVAVAELAIESLKTIFAFIFILVFFTYIYNDQRVMALKYPPNIPQTAYLMCIAITMGFGLKLVSEYSIARWKLFALFEKVLMFLVYVTCGVYSSISTLPPLIAAYFSWNPLIHLVEFGRQALHPGYPVWDVTTLYPLSVAGGLLFLGLTLRRYNRRTQ